MVDHPQGWKGSLHGFLTYVLSILTKFFSVGLKQRLLWVQALQLKDLGLGASNREGFNAADFNFWRVEP